MENENKIEEKVTEVTLLVATEQKTEQKKCFMQKFCKDRCKGQCKGKGGMVLGIIVLILLVAGSYGYKQYRQKVDIGPEAIKTKTNAFLKGKVPDGIVISAVTKENGVYKVVLKADASQGGQEQSIYVSSDGNKIFQGAIDMNPATPAATDASQNTSPAVTEAAQKTDVPDVKLFVMSFCPYGTQIEKGILPVIDLLKSKINFSLEFVDYSMHGPNEIDENTRQYCIEKTQQPKLDAYLTCYLKVGQGTADACMKTAGINSATVNTCMTQADTQFSIKANAADKSKWSNSTYPPFDVNKDDNTKYGVQGSPTLIINGTEISAGRDSASLLKAVCSGFTTPPKECSQTLSATAPAPGFGEGTAAAGAASSASAACATPAQ